MSQVTVNPFGTLGTEFSSGLGTMIGAYPTTITMAQLIAEVATIVQGIFYTTATTQVQIETQAIAAHVINSYVNSLIPTGRSVFNDKQMHFIGMLVGPTITANMPVLSLNNYILDVEDNITKSDLTVEEQIPLLIATMMGQTAYTYWTTDVAAGSPAWHNYYQAQQSENYANIPFWVSVAMEGALAGYAANYQGLIEPSTNNITTRMVAGLIGALAANTAKVALQIIPRIQPAEVVLNPQTIANLSGITGGGRNTTITLVTTTRDPRTFLSLVSNSCLITRCHIIGQTTSANPCSGPNKGVCGDPKGSGVIYNPTFNNDNGGTIMY